MLQVFPSQGQPDENADILDTNTVKSASFLCADNRDEDEQGPLRQYVTKCLQKILALSKKFDGENEASPEFEEDTKSFIIDVYKGSWEKFCERITKNNNRGKRLVDTLENVAQRHGRRNPPRLRNLIDAMKSVLSFVNSEPDAHRDYVALHDACTRLREEAFGRSETKGWLTEMVKSRLWTSEGATPFRIIQKIMKPRNAIESIIDLIKNEAMRPTFQALAQAENLTVWVPPGPKSPRTTPLVVDLGNINKAEIKKIYTNALSVEGQERLKYADGEAVWKRISDNAVNVKLPPKQSRVAGSPTQFAVDGEHLQHCEGKLLRYVIKTGLLGKVFPFIGCSKLCCEPCFTAIAAVNELIDKTNMPKKDMLHFAARGTHRKVYSGFGITRIEEQYFETPAFLETFNKLLCRDIGFVVKEGLEKYSGGSDSDP